MALDAVKNTVDRESEIRNILKNAARDHRLSTSEKDAILGVGRAKLRTLSLAARAAEHYGVDGLTVTGSNAGPLPAGLSVPAEVIAAPGGTLKIREGPIVEAELVESEPTHLIVREPALPVIDAANLGVALKMWQQLARVIEENTPECITIIGGKPWRNAEFWRTARLAYGADKPMLENEFQDYTNGRATCRVRLHMGRRQATATAIAERAEKGKADAPMNTLAGLAYTRALNRASREVIGLGTKSAEEVEE
jgi:hypothetical protein